MDANAASPYRQRDVPQLFQIHEDDLCELEKLLPQIAEAAPPADNRARVRLRRIQTILSNVRWNYGPHSDVTRVPDEGDDAQPS